MKYYRVWILFALFISSNISLTMGNTGGSIDNDQAQISVSQVTNAGLIKSLNITGNEFDSSLYQKNPKVSIGDGKVSEIWETAFFYDVGAFGSEGKMASVYGLTDVYFIFYQAVDAGWIALQWDTDRDSTSDTIEEMAVGDDMWVLGETTEIASPVLGDSQAHGTKKIYLSQDPQDDLYWERILVNDTDGVPIAVAWEVRRAKDTFDTFGKDVVFSADYEVSFMLASSLDGSHKQGNTVGNFTLSEERLGGDVPIVTNNVIAGEVDGTGYLLRHISLGLLYGMTLYILLFIPMMYIIKKSKETDK